MSDELKRCAVCGYTEYLPGDVQLGWQAEVGCNRRSP